MRFAVEFEVELVTEDMRTLEGTNRSELARARFRWRDPVGQPIGDDGWMYIARILRAPETGLTADAVREMLLGRRIGKRGTIRQVVAGADLVYVGMCVSLYVEGLDDGEL